MKITEQDKIELRFLWKMVKCFIAWVLIVGSLILGYCLESKFNPYYECYIAGDFVIFLLGMFILMKNKLS